MYCGPVDGLKCAPETGDTERGQYGGLTMPMPGHASVVHSTLVETMYFCASLRPSHEMRAGPVDLLPLCSFDDGSVSAETKSHHRSWPGYGDGLPLMRMLSGLGRPWANISFAGKQMDRIEQRGIKFLEVCRCEPSYGGQIRLGFNCGQEISFIG